MKKSDVPLTEFELMNAMSGIPMPIRSYSKFVASSPCLCWGLSFVFMFFFAAIGFITRPDDLPDFSRADKGFDTRGSDIAGTSAAEGILFSSAICKGTITNHLDGSPSYEGIGFLTDDTVLAALYTASVEACSLQYCCENYVVATRQYENEEPRRCPETPDSVCEAYKGVEPVVTAPLCSSLAIADIETCNSACVTAGHNPNQAAWIPAPPAIGGCGCLISGADYDFICKLDGRRTLEIEADGSLRSLEGSGESTPISDKTCSYSKYFLDDPTPLIQIVFSSSSDDLMDADTLKKICKLDDKLMEDFIKPYNEPSLINSDITGGDDDQVCWSRNLGNMIAYYYDLDSCEDITATNVEDYRSLLATCAPYYNRNELVRCTSWTGEGEESCHTTIDDGTVPTECFKENIVWDTLNALVDNEFLENGSKVKHTKLLPVIERDMEASRRERNFATEEVHYYLYPLTNSKFGNALLTGYSSGSKFGIFSKQLIGDNVFSGGAFLFVFCLMWLHSSSGFVSSLAFFQIFLNLGVAYGIYMAVLNLPFFPFLNMIGLFVVIGIGADDVFVFMDSWKQSMQVLGGVAELEDRLAFVLHRAGGSMLVTSLTTSSAFAANTFSPVTSLRCFGLFCAIIIIVDYVLMLCYVPALVVIHETYVVRGEGALGKIVKPMCCQFCKCCTFCKVPEDPRQLRPTELWFKETLGPLVLKGKFVFLPILLAIVAFLGFNASQLQRPTSREFQLFKSDHPMERYDMELKNYFNAGGADDDAGGGGNRWAYFTFGVHGEDTGNHWDPNDWGTLELVNGFSIADADSQARLAAMCDDVKDEEWYSDPCVSSYGEDVDKFCRLLGEVCPMRAFKHWVSVRCEDTSDDVNILLNADCAGDDCFAYRRDPQRTTCCGLTFPVQDEATFDECFKVYHASTAEGFWSQYLDQRQSTGIWFDKEGDIKIVKAAFPTSVKGRSPYEATDAFYKQLVAFVGKVTKGAGKSVSSLYGAAFLGFYDLQRSLSEGAYQSAGFSFLLAFLVLAATTRNPLLTCLSLFTIFCIVASIVGVLVLDGWQLNILESIIISVAVGMSVDFVAHYSHSYLHSEGADRDERVLKCMSTMGVSVLTGAITTFMAGFFMSLAQTLFFFQFGVFMMSTMGFAWIYTNFMFVPLISIVGPKSVAGGGSAAGGGGKAKEKGVGVGEEVEISPY
jgi:hypothetical protein